MFQPMLAEPATIPWARKAMSVGHIRVQQKFDGDRVIVETADALRFWNRDGATYSKSFPDEAITIFKRIAEHGRFVLDGELVTESDGRKSYHVFDVLLIAKHDGTIVLDETDQYGIRRMQLELLDDALFRYPVRLVREASDEVSKVELFEAVRRQGGEGVILRDVTAPYSQGKRALVKVKFTKTVDAIVTAIGLDGHNNCEYSVYEKPRSREPRAIGRCSLNGKPRVKIGDVIEVRYLYATHIADIIRLYQPRLVRVRDDKRARQCLLNQLQFVDKGVL